jgi:hypothetical protein
MGWRRVVLPRGTQILGHKTPRYGHLSPDYMAASVGKLDGIMQTMLLIASPTPKSRKLIFGTKD